MKITIKNLRGGNIWLGEATSTLVAVELAVKSQANLSGEKITALKVFTGLYDYTVHAVLYEDGSCWVRMGCLFNSLEGWEKIGIRNSNLTDFPNDGSLKCEERVAAFEFAKSAALRMAATGGQS